MNCKCCGAAMRMAIDSFHCDYCRNIVFSSKDDDGVRLLTEAPSTTCPICNLKLQHASLAGLPILACTRCRGKGIYMEVFPMVLNAARAEQPAHNAVSHSQADLRELQRTIRCPQCRGAMEAHFYAGPGNVIIDSCEACALNWLDHGDLKQIAQSTEDSELIAA